MFPTNYSPYDGLSKVFLVLIVIGALAALAFTNSDLTNFITNSAKAEGIKQELAIQNLKSIFDFENYKRVEEAKTKAQLDNIETEKVTNEKLQTQKLQAQAQQVTLELEMSRLFGYGKIGIGIFLSICLGIMMIQFGRSRLILAQAQHKQIDNQQKSTLWKMQMELARQHERMERASFINRTQSAVDSAHYKDQGEPILWEDLRQKIVGK